MKHKVRTRYHIFFFGLLCCLTTLNLEGCVFWGEKTWSDLNPTGFKQKENGVLHLQEVGLDIYAGNRDGCSAPVGFMGILVPIIPVPCFLKENVSELWILIQILPEISDFSFDPRQSENYGPRDKTFS